MFRLINLVATVVAVGGLTTPADADAGDVTVPPGLTVATITTSPAGGAIDAVRDPAFGDGAVVATIEGRDLVVRRIEPSGVTTLASVEVISQACDAAPACLNAVFSVEFDRDDVFGGDLVVTLYQDHNGSGSFNNGVTSVVRIAPDGTTTPLLDGWGFPDTTATGALSSESNGFLAGLYLIDTDTGFAVNIEDLHHLAPGASTPANLGDSRPPGITNQGAWGFERDRTTTFGGELIFVETNTDRLYRMSATKSFTIVTSFSGDVRELALSSAGSLGNAAFVTDESSDAVLRVAGDGTVTTFATGFREIADVAVSTDGETLWVTDGDGVHRISTSPWDSGWFDEGFGHPGAGGVPSLVGCGSLGAETGNSLTLDDAAPASVAGLFISLVGTPVPFKGGTLKAFPPLAPILLTTDATGSVALPFTFPSGVPSSTSLWAQWAIQDPGASVGVALSNAVRGDTP